MSLPPSDGNGGGATSKPSQAPKEKSQAQFATTRWSLVRAAAGSDELRAKEALGWLCERYWFPLYTFARRYGAAPEDAKDQVQGFFAHVLSDNVVSEAKSHRGQFRAFFLTCFQNYLTDEWRSQLAEKRASGVQISLDELGAEARFQREFTDSRTPEHDFDRAWVLTVMDRVLARLRDECEDDGMGGRFTVLQDCLQGDTGEGRLAAAALKLGVSIAAARSQIHRLRLRFRELMLREIRHTVADGGDVRLEIEELFKALGSTSS